VLEHVLIVIASRNGDLRMIMNQVRAKGNPQCLLGVAPEHNLSSNIRMCPMIQVNNVNNALEETSIYFMAIHSLGHKSPGISSRGY